MGRREDTRLSILGNALAGPEPRRRREVMPHDFQFFGDSRTKGLLDFKLVRRPLVVKSRRGQSLCGRHAIVDEVRQRQQGLRNDRRSAGRTERHERAAVLEDQSRAHT